MKMLWTYLRPFYAKMLLLFLIKSVGTLLDLASPMIFAHIVDNVAPTKDVGLVFIWGGIIIVLAFISMEFNIIPNRMAVRIARDTTERVRNDLFEKTLSLSSGQIDRLTYSSIEARLTTDTYNIHDFLNNLMRMGIRTPILLIGGIFVVWAQDPALTLVLVGMLPLMGAVVWKISRKGVPMYSDLQQSVDGLVRTVRENVSGVRVIKALSKTAHERQRFEQDNLAVSERESRASITMALTDPVMNLLLNLGLVVIIIVGAYRANIGLTKPGTIVAFLTYFAMFSGAMLWITRIFVSFSRCEASSKRICEAMTLPHEPTVFPSTQSAVNPPVIEFENVAFSYHKKTNNLENITFSIDRGETLGILGSTGSGKSTLVSLLMRFYDCDSGTVRIDGRPINTIPLAELYQKFGSASQNDTLFADSIQENIDFGRKLPQEQILKAARDAQADFILDLPDGFDYQLTAKGNNLSGGQKQRLIIARALAANPEILILDDSSSALDYQTDANLRQALTAAGGNTTAVVVAQRISSLMHADRILVLDNGTTVGYGTHEQLLTNCAIYNEIYNSQMGGESLDSSAL